LWPTNTEKKNTRQLRFRIRFYRVSCHTGLRGKESFIEQLALTKEDRMLACKGWYPLCFGIVMGGVIQDLISYQILGKCVIVFERNFKERRMMEDNNPNCRWFDCL
jgi:hypothetical protein